MKRILATIFFSLALSAIPYITFAEGSDHVGDCQQQQSQHQEQSASVDVSSTGDVDINIDASQSQSQSQSQNCDGNTPPPAPTPTPPPPAPPPPTPTPVPPPPSQCPDQHQEQSLSTTTENAVEINQVQSQTNNCPAPANALPVWKGPTHATTTLGTLMTFNASATDPDGDTLTFATELPSGATWAASTGVFSWTPTATTSLGTTTARFFASDSKGTSTHEVTLEVFPVSTGTPATSTPNRPPVFVDFNPPTRATSTLNYEYDANGEDPDNDPISFCLTVNPTGMGISTSTGLISWTPTTEQASTTPYNVTACVTDGKSTTTASYQILVASSTTATTTPTPPPPAPPPPSSGGGGGGGGTSPAQSTTPTPSSGGGGGGPPLGLFGQIPTPPSSVTTPSPTPVPAPSPAPTPVPSSPPKSDAAPSKPIGGITIKPTSTTATSAPQDKNFFGLGALSLLGLLNLWNWLKANCCLVSWLFWLLTVIAFLTYIYYLKRKHKRELGPPTGGGPMIVEEKVSPQAEWEWQKLKSQEEDNLL